MNTKYLGFIWGILQVSQDLNTYYLYVLLLITSPNIITCHNFLSYYTVFVFINTIVLGIFYPISGWITDSTSDKSSFVFLVTNILQLFFILLEIIPYWLFSDNEISWILLCTVWQISQTLSIQNNNSLWKLIKQIVESDGDEHIFLLDEKNNKNLVTINSIGNIGDLTSDIVESSILGGLVLFITIYYNIHNNLNFIFLYIFSFIIFLNIFLCFNSIILFRGNRKPNKPITENKSYKIRNPLKWVWASVKNFYKQKIVFHAFWHCILLNICAIIVQYPLTLKEVSLVNVTELKDTNNLCGGIVKNLFITGAITNSFYLLGSICYRIFIVKTKPTLFYKIHYPICILLLFGTTIAIWFQMYYIITLLLISFAVIIPYYLTYYDYYLFTEESMSETYGFVLGMYGAITTVVTACIQLLYFANPSFTMMLAMNITLLSGNLVYSFYLAHLCEEM